MLNKYKEGRGEGKDNNYKKLNWGGEGELQK